MIKQAKVWGDTTKLFSKNNVEIHRLNTNKGGYCSIHHHEFKYNQFYVESGQIEVTIFRENGIEETTVLKDNESTTVPPKMNHIFKSIKDSVVYEIYWVVMEEEDIIRQTVGGKIETENNDMKEL